MEKIIKGIIPELSFHILKQHISPSDYKSPGCRVEVLHSLLSDKWPGGQEIGFTTIKECIVKKINIA